MALGLGGTTEPEGGAFLGMPGVEDGALGGVFGGAAVHPVRRRQHPAVLDAEGPAEAVDRLDLSSFLAPYSLDQTLRHYPFPQNLLVMMIEADGLQGWLAQLEAVEVQQKKHEAAVPELVATAATPRLEQRPSRALLLDQVLGLMLLTVSP